MTWRCDGPTTRVKVLTTVTPFLTQHRLRSSSSSSSLHSFPFHSIFFSNRPVEMKNTRVREIRTIPPAAGNDSTEFTRVPSKQMQGKTMTESTSRAEWTDEKHSLYLKSMEASFVNQLYDSKQNLGWSSRGGRFSSGQFKVLQGGCWQRINFERENPQISRSNECHDLKANPWIQHFSASGHLHLCKSRVPQQDMFCGDTEMSDQNFVDEEVEEEKESKSSDVKRLKSLVIDGAGNDQIVPISRSSASGDATENCVTAA